MFDSTFYVPVPSVVELGRYMTFDHDVLNIFTIHMNQIILHHGNGVLVLATI
jgi:hypothetical protein